MHDHRSTPSLEYQSRKSTKNIRIWAIVLALPLPSILWACFVISAYWPKRSSFLNDSAWFGWIGLAICIAAGVFFLAWSRMRRSALVLILILYIPLQLGWLVVLGLSIACGFGDCI